MQAANSLGCRYEQFPDTTLAVNAKMHKKYTPILGENENLEQLVVIYRNTLAQKEIKPIEITKRLREITDKMGWFVGYLNHLTDKLGSDEITTVYGQYTIKKHKWISSEGCHFRGTPLETPNCRWEGTFDLTLTNKENKRSLSLTVFDLHCLAYHEFPGRKRESFHPHMLYDFFFADKQESSEIDKTATW